VRYLFTVIILATTPLCAQDQSYIDSLKQALNTSLADTTRVMIFNKLANILPEGEWEAYNEKLEKFAAEKFEQSEGKEKKIFLSALASAYNNKSLIYKYNGEISAALEYGEKSLVLFEQLEDLGNISTGSYNNGRLYYSLGDISRALRSFEYAMKIINTSENKELLPYCLNSLGFISKEQQDLEKAIEYHQKAYTISRQLQDNEALAYTATCMALVLFDQKRYAEAQSNFLEALLVYEKLGDVQNQAAQFYHLGQVELEKGLYNEAMKRYDQALALYTKRSDKPGLTAVFNAIGQSYFQQGDSRQAELYLQKSLTLGRELGFPTYIATPAEGLYKVYRQQGETKKALYMYELFIRMRDSVNNEAVRKKVLKAQYRYEFELKASADSLQAESEKEILHSQLSEERIQRYGLLGGLMLLLVTAGFAFSQFRIRKRLEELKLRNQIASDLHDEVGSAISSISLFAGMARMKQGTESAGLVEKIEETSRETISTMSDIVWSIEPANDSFQNVLRKMKQFGEQLSAPLNIDFRFTAEPGIDKLLLDMRQRKNLYLVYKEAVNNACKHAHPTTIAVVLQKKFKAIVMTITDNGQGFNVSQESSGYGTGSMKARTADLNGQLEIVSSAETGTSVTLTIQQ
jgi:two-component system, NarL family, sensor histidine kinase UhpB